MKLFRLKRNAPGWSLWQICCWAFGTAVTLTWFRMVYRMQRFHGDRVPETGPVIYVVNHQSHYDPLVAGLNVWHRPFRSIARASLFKFKPFGFLIRSYGAVPIERGRGDKGAIAAAIDVLKQGSCVLLFPEGGRTEDGAMQAFQRGFMLLVKRSGAPVLPIAIEGAHDIWPRGTTLPKLRGRLAVMAAEPVSAEDLLAMPVNEALQQLHDTIDGMRLELRARLRRQTGGLFPPPGLGDQPSDVRY